MPAQSARPVHARFAIECARIGLDPVLTINGLRLKEDDWVVLNPADPAPSAGKIKNGRLAIVKAIVGAIDRDIEQGPGQGQDWLELSLLDASFFGSTFRYPHESQMPPQPGALYTLDQMADDLNADKALDALRHCDSNALYQWMIARPADRPVSEQAQAFFSAFARTIDTVERPHALTRRAAARSLPNAWAIPCSLSRGRPGPARATPWPGPCSPALADAAGRGVPCRVAVSCKTHNAVNIVLGAIAAKQRKLALAPVPRALHGASGSASWSTMAATACRSRRGHRCYAPMGREPGVPLERRPGCHRRHAGRPLQSGPLPLPWAARAIDWQATAVRPARASTKRRR